MGSWNDSCDWLLRAWWPRLALAWALTSLAPVVAEAQLKAELVASGFQQPVALVPDPRFANVFYVVELGGVVRVVRDGQLLPDPFIDLSSVVSASVEGGLLGMAFAPDDSGRVFFNFTNLDDDTVIARYTREAQSPLAADPASRRDLRWANGERVIRQPFGNHNGGHLAFGPDGYLYIALGDGGGTNDPDNRAGSHDAAWKDAAAGCRCA